MKVKIYFKGKEIFEIECDSYLITNNGQEEKFESIDLFLKNQIIAHFDSKYSFVILNNNIEIKTEINHTLLKSIINGGVSSMPYVPVRGCTTWIKEPNKIITEYTS